MELKIPKRPRTPTKSKRKSIVKHCKWCSGDSTAEAKLCVVKDCPLYPFRMRKLSSAGKSLKRAIVEKCIDCRASSNYSTCNERKCELWGTLVSRVKRHSETPKEPKETA